MARESIPELFRTPLAERMRPRTLDDVIGQDALLGPGRPLRRQIEDDLLTSCILWGPPGCGKTSLARLFADLTAAPFVPFSAVTGGVAEVRKIVAEARRHQEQRGGRSLLFVDEIHRFNKGQQDAFLPHVESGLIVLIGATTENPGFHLNSALLSRCAVHVLHPLDIHSVRHLLREALADRTRGYGTLGLSISESALDALANGAAGDARRALGSLERIALHHRQRALDAPALERVDVEEALGTVLPRHDRAGTEHYEVASAFIKSMRGSDPQASLYYLARMLEGGDDPLFVARRLVIFASEDVGMADPRALQVAVAAKDAVAFVGMPEARYALSQATLYLSTAPKSDTTKAYFDAAALVREHGALPVPRHLRPGGAGLARQHGNGADYLNPHRHPHRQQPYLPEGLARRSFYEPSDQGYERMVAERLRFWASRRRDE